MNIGTMKIEFKTGENNLLTDVKGLQVGNADDSDLKSGVTVVTAQQPFAAAVDVMGGAPGTREIDALASDKLVTHVDALVLSGGSALGLDAASGVANALRAAGRGFDVAGQNVPIVPAAIIFDLHNGGEKNWSQNPYAELGRQAWASASANGEFKLGSVGAGFGALTPTVKGGLGAASLQLAVPGAADIMVAALVVANPLGSVTVPAAANFWAAAYERDNEYGGLGVAQAAASNPLHMPPDKPRSQAPATGRENTTLAIVATDANLDVAQLKRMAVAAQDGMARAIVPAHTPLDGDVVFALSTTHGSGTRASGDMKPKHSPQLQLLIGHAAAVCVSRAIARAVYEARPFAGDLLPAWREKYATLLEA